MVGMSVIVTGEVDQHHFASVLKMYTYKHITRTCKQFSYTFKDAFHRNCTCEGVLRSSKALEPYVEMKLNEWCFRSRFCTVRLYWAEDNLGK